MARKGLLGDGQTTITEFFYFNADYGSNPPIATPTATHPPLPSVSAVYQVKNPGASQVITKYYLAGAQAVAMRTGTDLYYLFSDHLGSTSISVNAATGAKTEMRYTAWGAVRYTSGGATPTDQTYTGQRSYASDFGLMYYNARWYDSSLGRFAQADVVVPGGDSVYTGLVVSYQENALLKGLNEYNASKLQKLRENTQIEPEKIVKNSQAFDRYAYVSNNPINHSDSTGHSQSEDGVPGDDWLDALEQGVQIIARNVPDAFRSWFMNDGARGTRLFTIDHPHGGADFYHINSDLKMLQDINHKNIEPLIRTVAAIAGTVASAADAFVNSPVVSFAIRMPAPVFIMPANWYQNMPGATIMD